MKCLILAGGCGDRLWPLSRKSYPKQFMEIHENRSLLQETVVRNLPYCQEFLIVTNESYDFIVEGQLKAFQGLRYRSFLEQEPRKTAGAIGMVCMMENPSELIYVVSSDTLMEGAGYQEAILRAKTLARENNLVAFGIPVTSPHTGYGYIRHQGEEVLSFTEKPDLQTARQYMESGQYLWNSGNFLFSAGTFLQELQALCPEVYRACEKAAAAVKKSGRKILLQKELLETVPMVSVEKAVFEHSGKVKVIRGNFAWQDIGRLEDLENAPIHKSSTNVIQHGCRDVTVINRCRDKLVVANGMEDMIAVNTEDAVYIGKKGASDQLKEIMRLHGDAYGGYFEENRVSYRPYGKSQILSVSEGYRVKKVTIYPGRAISVHRHLYRSEHWSVVEGSARISLWPEAGKEPVVREYTKSESIFVPVGMPHTVSNPTEKEVVIIEVAIGQIVTEEDIIRFEEKKTAPGETPEPVVRLLPAYKDYLWGGTRLREQFGKESDLERIAESWELSAHEAGQSIVAEGRFQGMLFGEYLERIGREAWGWKCQTFAWFPILVKFLDAREDLSIQVHPDDEYALTNENEYGKNEMWFVLDCKPGAAVYGGFSRPVTKEEVAGRIREGTLTEILHRIPVQPGDGVFIPAGTIHAVCGGVLLCEIQQNSNCTYRLFDYDRRDSYGNKRPLHVDKALQVLDPDGASACRVIRGDQAVEVPGQPGFYRRRLASCKYFESVCCDIAEKAVLEVDDASFLSLLMVEGSGTVTVDDKTLDFRKGDSFFVPAGKRTVTIRGGCRCIATHV